MLRKSYGQTIIGMNYLSIIYGIASLNQDKSTLILDDPNLSFANQWHLNIGMLERNLLIEIGQQNKIEDLINLDNYLVEQNTIFYINDKMIELCHSPYSNIKELARKFPASFSDVYQTKLVHIEPEVFDKEFFIYLEYVAHKSFANLDNQNVHNLFEQKLSDELAAVFESFFRFIERDELVTKQLHYVLQMTYQAVFSSKKEDLESRYLMLSLLAPRYVVDANKLEEDLLLVYRERGGDLRQTQIADWGVADSKLKYLLLAEVDGVVQVDQTHYFAQKTDALPFETKNGAEQFLAIGLKGNLNHDFVDIFKDKRILFSYEKRIGSDFPHWELKIDGNGNFSAIYAYADALGTKPSFYYTHALEDLFRSCESILPGLQRSDWIANTKLFMTEDIWFQYPPQAKKELSQFKPNNFKDLYDKESRVHIQKIYHCGPNRSKSLGLYSYLLDLFSDFLDN